MGKHQGPCSGLSDWRPCVCGRIGAELPACRERAMLHALKGKLGLVAGCCAASLAVGAVLGVGSLWMSRVTPMPTRVSSSPPPQNVPRTAPTSPAADAPAQGGQNNLPYARTRDGRWIHPVTGQACPKGARPTGSRGCVPYCLEQGMTYWEEADRCIPTSAAKTACEGKGGTWIVGIENQEGRCRVPLTEIDPRERGRLDRLGR